MLSKKLKDVKDPIIRYGAKIWASKSEIDGVIFTIMDIDLEMIVEKLEEVNNQLLILNDLLSYQNHYILLLFLFSSIGWGIYIEI